MAPGVARGRARVRAHSSPVEGAWTSCHAWGMNIGTGALGLGVDDPEWGVEEDVEEDVAAAAAAAAEALAA